MIAATRARSTPLQHVCRAAMGVAWTAAATRLILGQAAHAQEWTATRDFDLSSQRIRVAIDANEPEVAEVDIAVSEMLTSRSSLSRNGPGGGQSAVVVVRAARVGSRGEYLFDAGVWRPATSYSSSDRFDEAPACGIRYTIDDRRAGLVVDIKPTVQLPSGETLAWTVRQANRYANKVSGMLRQAKFAESEIPRIEASLAAATKAASDNSGDFAGSRTAMTIAQQQLAACKKQCAEIPRIEEEIRALELLSEYSRNIFQAAKVYVAVRKGGTLLTIGDDPEIRFDDREWQAAGSDKTFVGHIEAIIDGGKTVLLRGRERTARVPIEKLSKFDRLYVDAWQRVGDSESAVSPADDIFLNE